MTVLVARKCVSFSSRIGKTDNARSPTTWATSVDK